MKIRTLLITGLLGLACNAYAAELQMPTDAMDENDPRVLEVYKQRCDEWTAESKLQGEKREQFRANCMASAKQLWPVGWDLSQ